MSRTDRSIAVGPDFLVTSDGGTTWYLTHPQAKQGGGLFAVVTPWCGYCRDLKANVARAQTQSAFDFFTLTGDATSEHKKKSQEMRIPGFPMMYKIGKGGKLTEYNGGRGVESLRENFSLYGAGQGSLSGGGGWFW